MRQSGLKHVPKGVVKFNTTLTMLLTVTRKTDYPNRTRFADETGILAGIITGIENKNRKVNIGEMLLLCAALRIDPIQLCGRVMGDESIQRKKWMITDVTGPQLRLDRCVATHRFGASARLITKALGRLLLDYRKAAHHTMRSVAAIIETDHNYIAKVEAGRGLAFSELALFANIYGTTPEIVISTLLAQLNHNQGHNHGHNRGPLSGSESNAT